MELNNTINNDREQLRHFITFYRNLPILWDAKCPNYSKKDKRLEAYEKLLQVYRTIRRDATIMDVKKKINSMRSNFRKELKKVEDSAGTGKQYRPSSWMYDQLMFLSDADVSFPCADSLYSEATPTTVIVSDEEDPKTDNEEGQNAENVSPLCYPKQYTAKKPRFSESNKTDISQYSDKTSLKKSSDSCYCDGSARIIVDPTMSYNDDLASVWTAKLKHLAPLQKLFAEKAINDVLFEAQLGTLHRNSVQINTSDRPNTTVYSNDESRHPQPSQSSPEYKFSQTYRFTENDNNF